MARLLLALVLVEDREGALALLAGAGFLLHRGALSLALLPRGANVALLAAVHEGLRLDDGLAKVKDATLVPTIVIEEATDVNLAERVHERPCLRLLTRHWDGQGELVHQLVLADVPDVEAVLRHALVHVGVSGRAGAAQGIVAIEGGVRLSDVALALNRQNRDKDLALLGGVLLIFSYGEDEELVESRRVHVIVGLRVEDRAGELNLHEAAAAGEPRVARVPEAAHSAHLENKSLWNGVAPATPLLHLEALPDGEALLGNAGLDLPQLRGGLRRDRPFQLGHLGELAQRGRILTVSFRGARTISPIQ